MEFLDIRDKNGNPTGEVKERSLVHADGDIHGTSHVWIVRKNEKGSYDLLLQKRSENKDAFPGCYDISSAGHLPAGQDYLSSALRELEEELGIHAEPVELRQSRSSFILWDSMRDVARKHFMASLLKITKSVMFICIRNLLI